MLFEKTLEGRTVTKEPKPKGFQFTLETEREYNLKRIRIAYSNEFKKISKSKLIKMAIDNLVADIEEQASEEEAIEYLRSLYKEAEF